MDDTQPIQKVLAKITRGHPLRQIAVRRRNNAHVHWCGGVVRADRVHLSGLEKAEEQRLHPQAHFSHLVEEECSPVRHLQLSLLVTVRPGKAPFGMTEQFGLEEGLRESRAVDRDVWSSRARGAEMDLPCDQVLPDTALAGDQNFGRSGGRAPRHREHVEHQGARCDDDRGSSRHGRRISIGGSGFHNLPFLPGDPQQRQNIPVFAVDCGKRERNACANSTFPVSGCTVGQLSDLTFL